MKYVHLTHSASNTTRHLQNINIYVHYLFAKKYMFTDLKILQKIYIQWFKVQVNLKFKV